MSVQNLIEGKYGVKTSSNINPLRSSVLSTAVKIASSNPSRLSLLVVNLGATAVQISPSPDVSSSKGIYLCSNGGSISLNWQDDYDLVIFDWYGISSATCNIMVLEIVEISLL